MNPYTTRLHTSKNALSTASNENLAAFYDHSFYETQVHESLSAARIYLSHLWSFLQPGSVIDVGCGRGAWLLACRELGSTRLVGMDGNWNSSATMLDSAIQFSRANLNEPFRVGNKFELAISLEVAEHLAPASATTFIQSLTQASDAVLFSAACPHQGGTNHINERPHTYWANLFSSLGYAPFDLFRPLFWGDPRVPYYYQQNVFLYLRKDSSPYLRICQRGVHQIASIEFMNCIHPRVLETLRHQARCEKEMRTTFRNHLTDFVPSLMRAIKRRV